MGSSASKSESGSSGSEWTGKLYFDPEADKSGPIYPIRDDELCTRLKEFVELNEKILPLEIHTHPLNDGGYVPLLYHAFIVFQTDGWYWSIEKNVLLILMYLFLLLLHFS